jgi:hypothetical protein
MRTSSNNYRYLRRKPGSNYKQLWIFDKGRYVFATTAYADYVNEESPMTVEEIAEDHDLPIEAVREAITYCESDPPEIRQDWEDEEAISEALGMNDPSYRGTPKCLPLEEWIRLTNR